MRPRWYLWATLVPLLACDITGDLAFRQPAGEGGGVGGPGGAAGGGAAGGDGGGGGEIVAGWARSVGRVDDDTLEVMLLRGDELFIAGDHRDQLTMDGMQVSVNAAGAADVFVATLDAATGLVASAKGLASPGEDGVADGASHADGDVALVGAFLGSLAIPTQPLTSIDSDDTGWVAKVDGTVDNGRWSTTAGTSALGGARLEVVATHNDVLVAGTSFTSVGIAGMVLDWQATMACDQQQSFVAAVRETSPGVVSAIWGFALGTPALDFVIEGLAVAGDALFVGAQLDASLSVACTDFSTSLVSTNFTLEQGTTGVPPDIYVAVVTNIEDPSQTAGVSATIGSDGEDEYGAMVADGDGVWITGHVGESGSCPGSGHTGEAGIFLCRLDATASTTSSLFLGSGSEAPQAIAVAPDGALYIAGSEPEIVDFGDGAPRTGPYITSYSVEGNMLTHEKTISPTTAIDVSHLSISDTRIHVAGKFKGLLHRFELDGLILEPLAGEEMLVTGLPR